ncbi:MAG: type I 3-dehydroquinate dehydratase [Candidatus Kerfeldbacteria bacterium]|nr:type I 3-dehydroquinate dehydratase [Candidatus Kerfeldbacteria bacterium]
MIAVSLTRAQDFKKALNSGADYLELRTDYFTNQQLKHFVEHSTLPVIYTIKRPTHYIPKVAYVDRDSFHDYHRTPSYQFLDHVIKKISFPKIATQVNTVDDLYTLAKLQKKYGKKAIIIGMGELGMMTRVYNKSVLTYASVSKTTATAPGQLTVAELKSTRIFGLIGDDIQNSLSPKLHHGQSYRYQLWQTDDLQKFMFVFNWFQLPGASVTKPFKIDVMKYCDRLDNDAKTIGAVNTIVRQGKQLVGYNTDWIGVQKSIGKYLKHKTVLILGRGGAAKAVAYAAQQADAKKVTMLGSIQLLTTNYYYDVLVNATPVTDHLLVSAESLKGKVVMDCVYAKKTELLRQAKRQGAKVVLDGLPMLRYQAIEQAKLFNRQYAR